MTFARPRVVLALAFCVACSDDGNPSDGGGGNGAAAGSGGGAGAGGAGLAAAGGSGNSGSSSGGNRAANGGTGAGAPDAGVGAAGASSGRAGGSAGGSSGGAAGSTVDAGGAGSTSAACAEIEAEYASSFAEQITCNPAGNDQCEDRIEALPGCDCLAFIEPKDPFAIEDLLNVYIDWLDADCENPTCPSPCPSGPSGTCGSNGFCTAEP